MCYEPLEFKEYDGGIIWINFELANAIKLKCTTFTTLRQVDIHPLPILNFKQRINSKQETLEITK